MKKYIISIILMILPIVASADAIEIDGIYYSLTIETKTADVARNPNKKGIVVIPNYVLFKGTEYNVNSIENAAFKSCRDLTSVIIPNSVNSIGDEAFSGCVSLAEFIIPNSVTCIGKKSFYNCNKLERLEIGSSVISIGDEAFSGCESLQHGRRGFPPVSIPNSVTTIGKKAFAGCTKMTSLTMGKNVTSIGEGAFSNCTWLESIIIPNSVTSIGNDAFSGCSSLAKVTIGNNVTSIKYNTFAGCKSLKDITIGNKVTYIGNYAFLGCDNLSSVNISDLSSWCNIQFGDNDDTSSPPYSTSSNPLYYAHRLFLNGTEIKNLEIPNNVTSIKNKAFYNCTSITSLSIPNSVTSIGNEAFTGCTDLSSVTIGNNVTSVGNKTFSNCYKLTTMTIGKSVASIGEEAFCNCVSLTSVDIPNSVTSISNKAFAYCANLTLVTIGKNVNYFGNNAFQGCKKLTSVNISDISGWCNIQIGANEASPLYYAHRLFLNGTEIKNLEIPNNVTSIKDKAFYNCTSITSVSIPNSTTSIGNMAFSGCNNMISVTIGSGIESISASSFAECTELKEVYCYAEKVPETSLDAFTNSYIDYVTLHVPDISINDYYEIEPWKDFYNIKEIMPKHTLTYIINGDIFKIYQVEEGKIITPEPDPTIEGYTFSGWSVIPETMPAYNIEVTSTLDKIIKRGDVNRDDKVDITDIEEIINYIMGKPSFQIDEKIAKVNDDSQVNIADIVEVVNIIKNGDSGDIPAAIILEVSSTSLSFDSPENTDQLFITCNDSWTANSDQSWCTISPAFGTGNGILSIAAAENTNTDSRSATVTLMAGTKIKTVTVTQKGKIFIEVSSTSLSFDSPENTDQLLITCNDSWIANSDQSWCTISPAFGTDNGILSIAATENTNTDSRSATVTLMAGTIIKTVTITQKGKTFLEVSSTSISFDSQENTNQLFITCNDSWTTNSDLSWYTQSWCTISPTSGTGNGNLSITVTENTSTNDRSTYVMIVAGTETKIVSVTQKGADKTPVGVVAVDLELPSGTLWANMNIGANRPEDYGEYFSWGETTKGAYDWSSYNYCDGSAEKLTKYCTSSSYCSYTASVDNKTILDSEDDAATTNWGNGWYMPTKEQCDELRNNTTYEWTKQNGKNGYKFTSKSNGNSIFLPAAGCRWLNNSYYVGSEGYYWSSELYKKVPSQAWYLRFINGICSPMTEDRYFGYTVRPVRRK